MSPATGSAIIVNVPQQATPLDYLGLAGFILSLILGTFEFYRYWNDRAWLKISARYDQQIMAMDAYGRFTDQETGKTFWSLDVANVGRKPIIITGVSLKRNDIKKMSLITEDYSGLINRYTLSPGDSHSYTIADELMNPKKVIEASLFDATGKVHKKKLRYKK
jgi:hypothetical protein